MSVTEKVNGRSPVDAEESIKGSKTQNFVEENNAHDPFMGSKSQVPVMGSDAASSLKGSNVEGSVKGSKSTSSDGDRMHDQNVVQPNRDASNMADLQVRFH